MAYDDEHARLKSASGRRSALRALMIAVLVVVGVAFAVFRINRAAKDIRRAKLTSSTLLEAGREYERGRAVVSSLGKLIGASEVTGVAEAIADLIADGEISRFKEAVDYARRCDEDLDGEHGVVARLFYAQPVPCRRMFKILGEPGELAEAGVTFSDAAQRLVPSGPPGSMEGPACHQWRLQTIAFEVPPTTPGGESWDAFGGAPDPALRLTVGAGHYQGPTVEDSFSYLWTPSSAIVATSGSRIHLEAVDEDIAENDAIFHAETTLPTHLPGKTLTIRQFTLGLECVE